ncbi:DUF2523 family protein [Aeromonas dhakensis]|uniref:DUF2523 family protein n=1 Tax=Aeromonas dhakensis TaxID=196024 RepID=UPI003BA048FB|nr:DUF2523 domain-containing protein [Aeromonas dhakensis]
MRNMFVLCLMFIPAVAMAADTPSFLDYVGDKLNDIHYTITEEVPGVFHRFTAWGIEFYTLCVITAKLEMIKFAYLVAKQITTDINLSGYLLASISQLPSPVRWALELMGFVNGLNLIINAYVTRFVLSIMGW